MAESILDEGVIRSFALEGDGASDAIAFGRLFLQEADFALDEITCSAFPPDGVKVMLTVGRRRLTLYFLGSGRFVFGRSLLPSTRVQEGEMSLEEGHGDDRRGLFDWLAGRQE
jgi:hypothetical protein